MHRFHKYTRVIAGVFVRLNCCISSLPFFMKPNNTPANSPESRANDTANQNADRVEERAAEAKRNEPTDGTDIGGGKAKPNSDNPGQR